MQRFIFSKLLCFAAVLIGLTSLTGEFCFAYTPHRGNITAAAGPLFYKTNFKDSGTGAHSAVKGGVGLLVNGEISEVGAFEIGMYHMNKSFFRDTAGLFIGEETELMQINMGYRRWLSPMFSSSLTFYSSYSMGDPRIIHNDFAATSTIDTSARDTTEYGIDLSLQAEVWSQDRWAAIVNTIYSYSLTPKPSENSDHFGIFIALRYFIQGQQESISPPSSPAKKTR